MRTGSNSGALGGPPAQVGRERELALAPARFIVTCTRKHKYALDCQKQWECRSFTRPRLSPTDPLEHTKRWVERAVVTAQPNERGEYDFLDLRRFACPTCGAQPSKVAEMLGHWAAEEPCSAKCTNATGPNCDCACGGMNHGSKALHWYETYTVGKPSLGRAAVAVEATPPRQTRNPTPRTFIPPPAVADAARYGLDLRASLPPSKRGGTDVGLRRAVQLANRQPVSVDTLKRMRSYFQRHAVDAQGRGWGHDSRGWVAWLLWGSDEGNQWCNQILDRLGV